MDLALWDCLGRIKLIAKFHRTDLLIFSHTREGKTPSYSQINKVQEFHTNGNAKNTVNSHYLEDWFL